jgi:hypothetical protein
VDVDEGNVVDAGEVVFDVVLGPEELDYSWSAEHHQPINLTTRPETTKL